MAAAQKHSTFCWWNPVYTPSRNHVTNALLSWTNKSINKFRWHWQSVGNPTQKCQRVLDLRGINLSWISSPHSNRSTTSQKLYFWTIQRYELKIWILVKNSSQLGKAENMSLGQIGTKNSKYMLFTIYLPDSNQYTVSSNKSPANFKMQISLQ